MKTFLFGFVVFWQPNKYQHDHAANNGNQSTKAA